MGVVIDSDALCCLSSISPLLSSARSMEKELKLLSPSCTSFSPPSSRQIDNTPFVVTEPEVAQQLQADQLYLPVPSGSLLVPERDPYTQLQEHFSNQGLPQYVPFGNPPSQITSYTGSDALFPLSSLAQQLQANQLYLPVPSGSLLVPERDPYTQLQEHFNNQGLPQYVPFGNPPSQITSYTGSDALFPLSSPNDTPGPSTQKASPQSIPPSSTHAIHLENIAGTGADTQNNKNGIPSSSLDFGLNVPIETPVGVMRQRFSGILWQEEPPD
ncbi:hypothetical protein PCANC_04004 [Puccinia coronata f. sp. avenae]|uniref:Uncharacterized protein n=1 Tax=Puccinia coronata f. sp. avenae TaxID=200324 RepID=A0A2N5T7U7_9BASI|nr:hypothetical protein PCANC_04004 [Puccinia coronata f. sp. avenae]